MLDVTVITPTIPGREGLLEECKASVLKQETPIKDHLIKMDKARVGPAVVRNELVEQVETEWIAFLDDDDLLLPNHFSVHKKLMETDADVVFSWCYIIHPDGRKVIMESKFDPIQTIEGPNTLPVVVTMRTQLFKEVEGFPDQKWEDWELWKKLCTADATFLGEEEVTWHYRITPQSRNQTADDDLLEESKDD